MCVLGGGDRDRQTDRDRDRQTETKRDRQTDRQTQNIGYTACLKTGMKEAQ